MNHLTKPHRHTRQKVESTRKAMDFAFNNVCAEENSKRLDELVALRAQARGVAIGEASRLRRRVNPIRKLFLCHNQLPELPQVAALLGYPSWAAYLQEELMAKKPQRVEAFLEELRGRLLPVSWRGDRGRFEPLLSPHLGASAASSSNTAERGHPTSKPTQTNQPTNETAA
jgi:hypothetical protein